MPDKKQPEIVADEIHQDDAKSPARQGRSYADVGGHGARHERTTLDKALQKDQRRKDKNNAR